MNILSRLQQLVEESLDEESGCHWLKDKTFQDISSYSLEEVYELVEAIEQQDFAAIKSELGDLFYHLIIYCKLAEKQGEFTLNDVIQSAIDKVESRRNLQAGSAEEAHKHWHQKKQQERSSKEQLSDIPKAMPALARTHKLQERARTLGFDWPDKDNARLKLDHEITGLYQCIYENKQERIFNEYGEVLFTLVALGRHNNIDPELALIAEQERFVKRFHFLEKHAEKLGLHISELSITQTLEFWRQAKQEIN